MPPRVMQTLRGLRPAPNPAKDEKMPTGKLYANGLTMGMGGNPKAKGGPRGEVVGWSPSSVRRHTRWLYGVDTQHLDGLAWSLTLTMRECPPSHLEWQALRARYVDTLTASGVVLRSHWVTEWTRRKVPHLHMAVYFKPGVSAEDAERLLVDTWIQYASRFGTSRSAQHMAPIYGALGWLEYLSKHAARGVAHYQRSGKPSGWEKTGRLWGHTGTWPTTIPIDYTTTREEFWRFRRLVRSWRIADARKSAMEGKSSFRRVTSARHMLRCNEHDLSQVRGVSEWIPEQLGMELLNASRLDRE